MIFPISILATAICLLSLLIVPTLGVFITLVLKPIIDASWNQYFFGVNCLKILGFFVPLLLLPRILFSRAEGGILKKSMILVAVIYLLLNCFGTISMIGHGNYQSAVEIFLRSLNGFLGFLMIQHFVKDQRAFAILLVALLIAGLFPMLFGLYQAFTGQVWQLRETSLGTLTRNVGLYHDAFSIRAYGYQTLTAILLSWVYFTNRNYWKKAGLIIYGAICSFVIFKSYSKAALVIFVIWLIIWSVFNRKIYWLLIIPVALVIINFAVGNRLAEDVEKVFLKEIGAASGTIDEKYILAGRTIVWKDAIDEWYDLPMSQKFLGSGKNLPVHNEFLRHLIANGFVGLFLYVILFIGIGYRITINMITRNTALSVMGFMVFMMWFMDNLGLHPGLYPAYQWYIFGFITLAIRGIEGLDPPVAIVKQTHRPVNFWTSI